jgi:dolichol-phosphate mannosyltransferase
MVRQRRIVMLRKCVWATSLEYFGQYREVRWQKIFKFAFVGATGAILNLSIIFALTNYILIWYMISAIIAIECSILWNFYLNTKLTFNYKFLNGSELLAAGFKYHLASFAGLIINIAALFALTEFLKIYYLFSELLAIVLAFGINYFISIRYVWHERS